LLTVGFAIVAGTIIGTLTGFVRGWTDRIIMAFNNALLAFPGLLLALGLLVDDAIIAVEMMAVKLEQGWSRARAAAFAYTSTAFPMLTGTLVT
ncbi:hypothetical protein, partial [Escherichia coli]|uniref:hypothetical protein n=1 Tax=Escherichia coli TaxID=562 RepID=UPI002282ADDF